MVFLDDVSSHDLLLSSKELYKYDQFSRSLKTVISQIIYEEFGFFRSVILVDGVKSWSKMRRILSVENVGFSVNTIYNLENGGMTNLGVGKVQLATQDAVQTAIQGADERQP